MTDHELSANIEGRGQIVHLETAPRGTPLTDVPAAAGAAYLEHVVAAVVEAIKPLVERHMGELDRALETETRRLDPAGLTQPVVNWTLNLHLTERGEALRPAIIDEEATGDGAQADPSAAGPA